MQPKVVSEALDRSVELKDLINQFSQSTKAVLSDMIGDAESIYVKHVLDELMLDCVRFKLRMIEASQELVEIHNAQNNTRRL